MMLDRAELMALVISIAIESIFVGIWGQFRRLKWQSLILVASASTLVTHPILWKLFTDLAPYFNFNILTIFLETCVAIAEGGMYKLTMGYSWRSSLGLSFAANLCSYSFGLVFYRLQ